ncbi:MAG: poly(U)-specific endoribonuclease-C-like [Trebouxia sp. A1-2]|nr:MAG: poly(U)-specific endoribonuclease-C-like [Trebouxia sp. A1-2]
MKSAPTYHELDSLSAACQQLWQLDANRLQPGQHYDLKPQQGKKSYMERDVAPAPLFVQVNWAALQQHSTYALFFALLDNYHAQVGEAEHLTAAQNLEVQQFLDGVVQTQCMQYVHQILIQQQLADRDVSSFKQQLYQMWFRSYTREVRDDSSGFEHVFVGEARDGKILGLHNWIQFSNQERQGKLDYKGYIFPRVHRHGCCEPVALQKPCLVTMSHLVTLPVLLFYVCRNLPAYAHDISRSSSLLCDPDLMPGAVALNMLAAMYLYRPLAERCGVYSLGGQQEEVDANERMLSVQFTWNGQLKDVSSMFIGTSPEFELALYTLCFLAGQEENIVQVGDYEVKIKVYRIKSKYGDKVGSAYPELIQKLSGRAGATTHAPAPLQQQAPWHSQGQQSNAQYQHPGADYGQGHQTGFAPQQQAQPHAQQPAAFQQGQQQAWGGQQASEPAQQGCGGFVKALLGALFGK